MASILTTTQPPAHTATHCARCHQPFSNGFSGVAVNGTQHMHYPNCPKPTALPKQPQPAAHTHAPE